MSAFTVEPTGRDDDWAWQVVRQDDGCVVGLFQTPKRAQAFADNGGKPLSVKPPPQIRVNQLDLFGGLA